MNDLLKALKVLAEKRMGETLERLCRGDEDYNSELSNAVELQSKYETINLDDSHREIIDSLLEARDCAGMERVSLAYLAGLEDCIKALWELNVIEI